MGTFSLLRWSYEERGQHFSLQSNVNAPGRVSPHWQEVIRESGGKQCCLWSGLQCITGFEISKMLDKCCGFLFFFSPKVSAFVSVIAVKRCVKTVVVKLPSRFVAIVLVLGVIMKVSRKSDLKCKHFNSSHWYEN